MAIRLLAIIHVAKENKQNSLAKVYSVGLLAAPRYGESCLFRYVWLLDFYSMVGSP